MSSTLMSHVDTSLVTRKQLANIAPVIATPTFRPVPHIELVETLESILKKRSINIVKEQFAIGGNGNRLFGTFDLDVNGVPDSCASMGLRTANDKSMSIQIIAGLRVFVCDNMVLNGDFIALKRRHTSGLNLADELFGAVDKYEEHYATLKGEVENLKAHNLTDLEAKAMIEDVFMERKMPLRLLPDVHRNYFNPPHAEFEPRTAWSLHNAFTEVAKVMPLTTRMDATQAVGRFFGLMVKQPTVIDATVKIDATVN